MKLAGVSHVDLKTCAAIMFGILSHFSVVGQPIVQTVQFSGDNLIFSGTNGVPNGGYLVLTSTNVAVSLTSWAVVATNTFDVNGAFAVTNVINPATDKSFFCSRCRGSRVTFQVN